MKKHWNPKEGFNIGALLTGEGSSFYQIKKAIKAKETAEFKKAQAANTSTRLNWYENRTTR